MRVGVLALQGGYQAHVTVLERLNIPSVLVTHPQHLTGLQGLILPGGESTTMLKLLVEEGLFSAIQEFAKAGRCLFGTCAGAILLANQVLNPYQPSLGLIDVCIERNAYGRQIASRIEWGYFLDQQEPLEMVFIRAPKLTTFSHNTTVFATSCNQPVGVMTNRIMLTTFHPELTVDNRIHSLFLSLCAKEQSKRKQA